MQALIMFILQLAIFVFIARALLSWFRIGHDSPFRPVVDGIHSVTEPVLAPIRQFLPAMGGFDLSIIVVIFGIRLVLMPIAASILPG